jgi:PHP family Zn ribbon phosphoesterase
MLRLLVDLHLHSVLSPCAEVEMIPPLIVRRAQELHLGIIGITDHNCAANAGAVIEAAAGTGITVLPGMEVQTREEVHMLCLFDTLEQVETWQDIVTAALPNVRNREEFFGAQYVVDHTGEYLYTEERLLSTSTSLSVEQLVADVNALGGICLPAHIDRPSFSILSNLGFIPPALPIAGIEFSPRAIDIAKFVLDRRSKTKKDLNSQKDVDFSSHSGSPDPVLGEYGPGSLGLTTPRKLIELFSGPAEYGVIVNSDAHRLVEMGAYTCVQVAAPTVAELGLALSEQRARCIDLVSP